MQSHQALEGRVEVFKPAGRLVGGPETEELAEAGRSLVQQGRTHVLVDLADVQYVNSIALGAFTGLYATCSKAGGTLKLCNVPERVRELFDVVRFNVLFEYHPSEEAALQAFAKDLASNV